MLIKLFLCEIRVTDIRPGEYVFFMGNYVVRDHQLVLQTLQIWFLPPFSGWTYWNTLQMEATIFSSIR